MLDGPQVGCLEVGFLPIHLQQAHVIVEVIDIIYIARI